MDVNQTVVESRHCREPAKKQARSLARAPALSTLHEPPRVVCLSKWIGSKNLGYPDNTLSQSTVFESGRVSFLEEEELLLLVVACILPRCARLPHCLRESSTA